MTEGVWGVEFPRSLSFPRGGVHPLEKSLGTHSSLETLSDLWSPVIPMSLCVSVCMCVCVNMHASACTTKCVPAQVG